MERDDGYDLAMSKYVLVLLPQRLGESQALLYAVDCLLNTWSNARRGLDQKHVLDLKSYGKALRCLQIELDDPRHSVKTGTLAATSILQRIEASAFLPCYLPWRELVTDMLSTSTEVLRP